MEIFRALAALAEPPTEQHAGLARALALGPLPKPAEHADCFLFSLFPYASVYLGVEGMMGGPARDRIAGFWRALGLDPPPEPDHLVVLLSFYASLADAEADEARAIRKQALRHTRAAFFHEHLLSWLPAYLRRMRTAAAPFYRGWAALLEEALRVEARGLGEPPRLPLALREAPPVPRPDDLDADTLLRFLLSPIASGVILTRQDLRQAAEELGLGLRISERRFALRALIAEDGPAMIAWLSRNAAECGRSYRSLPGASVARWWSDRAAEAACLLERLGNDAHPLSAVP